MGVGGCLGPKKNKDEIYTKLIKQMHEESYKIAQSEHRNLDIYQTIKQKIVKKGYLKKCLDNLSTRRHKVLQSLNLNYKLTSQSKQIERHYVGLIILDAIMDVAYYSVDCVSRSNGTVFEEEKSDGESSFDWDIKKKVNNKSKPMNMSLYPSRRLEFNEQNQAAYDQQYFRLVTFLFENQRKMHYRLLQSMTTFCQKHPGFISCEDYVWKTIERLIVDITKNIYLNQNCLIFSLLLQRTRDEAHQQLRNEKTMITIIKIWLIEKQTIDADIASVQSNCFKIIQIYFQRLISSWCGQFLYEVIFTIYDDIQFHNEEGALLEKMYEEVLDNSDLKDHFFRGLFNYLLSYLSVTHETYVTETDKKWYAASLGLSYQKIRSLYKNILKDQVKVQCFKLLSRWASKNYANVDEFCMYNNKALIFVYLANCKYYHRHNSMLNLILNEYFKIIQQLNPANKRLFVDRVVQNFREDGLTMIQYALLLHLISETVQRKILENPKGQKTENCTLSLYLIPVWSKYSHELNLEVLKLVGYVVENQESIILNEESKNKLCELFYSIYENLIASVSNLEAKYQFACAAVSLCRVFFFKANNYMLMALAVFIVKVQKQFQAYRMDKNMNVQNLYMLVYLIEQLKFIITPLENHKSSQINLSNMLKINSQIQLTTQKIGKQDQEVSQQIVQFMDLYFMPGRVNEQLAKPIKINEEEMEEFGTIMARLFGNNTNINSHNKFQLNRKTSRDSQSMSVYSMNSRGSVCEKCRSSINFQNRCRHRAISDGSFKDILDIVHV